MHWQESKRSDLRQVFQGLARRMAAEYKAAGLSVAEARRYFRDRIDTGAAHTLMSGGIPTAIVVWEQDEGEYATSFAAIGSFFSARYVRSCKRHVREIQANCGNAAIVSHSWSAHDDLVRWFKAIGFREEERSEIGYRIFRLPAQLQPGRT